MWKIRWCLLTVSLVSLAACDGGGTCEPETDLAFCSRQGFMCGEATGFDNCEASRTVSCGMCSGGDMCVANLCSGGLDAGDRDGGGDGDGGDGASDAGASDGGAPDAGTCLASNGWPVSSLPVGYVGNGYAIGNQFPPVYDLIDQYGATDVELGQFYGAMIILAMHAPWSPPSGTMDATAQSRLDTLNGETSEYVTVQLSMLIDDYDPVMGTSSTAADAMAWHGTVGGTFPILAGPRAAATAGSAGVASIPTIYVLDPTFVIRDITEGWPGDANVLQSVRDAWTAFRAENPSWTSTYCTE